MAFDLKVFELGWDFILAGERYRTLDMEKVPVEEQVDMTGLFRQATFGDIDINYSQSSGQVLANGKAWKACQGLSKPDAIRKYVEKANQLVQAYEQK